MFRTSLQDELNQTISELKKVSNALGFYYIGDGEVRRQFFAETEQLISRVQYEVRINCMSQQGAINTLKEEVASLREQEFQMITGRMSHYAAVEKKGGGSAKTLLLKQVGFIGGGSQIFAGFGVCMASMGTACAAFGSPLIAHGLNNFYENGYYLLFRKERSGYTREGYRKIAQLLGYSGNQADYAYGVVDISLSGYGMFRKVDANNSFRLFRNINSDFVAGWKSMGKIPLAGELVVDGVTLYGIERIRQGG